jgi:uncharacterized protein (TIGR00369 family)
MMTTEQLRLSPVHDQLQMNIVRYKPGVAVVSMPLTDGIRGFYDGTIHGGMLATLADAACASCLWGTYDFGPQFTVTTDIHVRYYRQPKSGPLIAEAKMVHRGEEASELGVHNRRWRRARAAEIDRDFHACRRPAELGGNSPHRLTHGGLRTQFYSRLVDLVVCVRHDGGDAHSLALAGK